jgi:hypothetical protein
MIHYKRTKTHHIPLPQLVQAVTNILSQRLYLVLDAAVGPLLVSASKHERSLQLEVRHSVDTREGKGTHAETRYTEILDC